MMQILKLLPVSSWVLLLILIPVAAGSSWRISMLEQSVKSERERLEKAAFERDACGVSRLTLEQQVQQQQQAVTDMRAASEERSSKAAAALMAARQESKRHYAEALKLQQQRTGGNDCASAAAVIDEVLGL